LNAILGGVLAAESFALSQAFYIGRSAMAAHYESQEVAGYRCIDEAEEVSPLYPVTGTNGLHGAAVSAAAEAANDPVLVALRERGMLRRQTKRGTWAIVCPWESEHSGNGADTATAYLQPGFDGRVNGAGFDCKHSHCAHRTLRDLRDFLALSQTVDQAGSLQRHQNASLRDAHASQLPAYQPSERNALAADLAGVELQRGDAIEPQPVKWLWRGFLAAGKLHILAGAPGTGKTTVALALAATITVGGRWPDGTHAEPGDVLIWSGEDDVADTLIPRLLAAGADRSRVHFARRTTLQTGEVREFDPATDFPMLSVAASQVPDLRMLLLDPVVSVVGKGTDSHKNSEVRVALQPLADFGDRHQCAVFGVSHFSKGTAGRDPVERVTGSLAFGAAPRVVFAAAKLADDEGGGRVIVRAKSNIGPDGGGFRFDLGRVEIAPGIEGQRVLWGEAVEGAAREILATAEQDNEPGSGDAKEFLRDLLEGGPMPAVDVFKSAEANGYSKRQMQRAREAIAEKHKDGMHGGWIWTLPKMPLPTEDVEGATFLSMEPSAPSAPAKMPIPREDAEDASLSNLAPSRLRDEATPSVTPSEVI
jgi:putative DNA primase/helicase